MGSVWYQAACACRRQRSNPYLPAIIQSKAPEIPRVSGAFAFLGVAAEPVRRAFRAFRVPTARAARLSSKRGIRRLSR
jgi:hypothetical protein